MSLLTRWVLAHKFIVVTAWVIAMLVGFAFSQTAANALSQTFELPGREAYLTNLAIERTFGNGGASNPIVGVVTLPQGVTVDSPGIRAELRRAFSRVKKFLPGSRVVSYGSTPNRVLVSSDGRTTMGLVYVPRPRTYSDAPKNIDAVRAGPAGVRIAGAPIPVTGQAVLVQGSSADTTGPNLLVETILGGAGALLILIFVFRSFMALVPLLMAVVAVPTTFLLVLGLTKITNINFLVEFLVALIGLGLAIDYSLLIVFRRREERARALDNEAAVRKAMETAGRAVFFSGTTVAIGLLALIVPPVPFLRSTGYGGMLIPLVTVAVALTLLPVILATVGPRMDWPRYRRAGEESRFWHVWAAGIVRYRWIAASAGTAILPALVAATSTEVDGGECQTNRALSVHGSVCVGR
jgi:RND superfamily putative drug exporter